MPGILGGLKDIGTGILEGAKKRPGLAGLGVGLSAIAAPWAYRKMFGQSPESALNHADAAQFGGFPKGDAQTLYSILTAAGIRRRNMQNTLDYMNASMSPNFGQREMQ